MSVSQISVFLESRAGHLERILDAFEFANVNVRGFSASDTGDYGIVRFVVDDPDAAMDVLTDRGAACVRSEVLCLKLADIPGEFARIVGVLAKVGINIAYCYSLISTYIVISVEDVPAAEQLLAQEPVDLVSQDEIAAFSTSEEGR